MVNEFGLLAKGAGTRIKIGTKIVEFIKYQAPNTRTS